MVKSNAPATKVGIIYALALSVFPSCQNPKLAAMNTIPKSMKNEVESCFLNLLTIPYICTQVGFDKHFPISVANFKALGQIYL